MSVLVHLPTALRAFAGGRGAVETDPGTVAEVLEQLTNDYAKLRGHLFQPDGRLRSFVNVYVNDRDIRDLDREETRAVDGDEILIVPSIAGGAALGPTEPPELRHNEILRLRRCIPGLLLAVLACGGGAARHATVRIIEPADRAVVSGSDVRVVLAASGVEIAAATEEREGTAHHHLFVDRDLTPLGDTIPSGVTGIIHLGRGQREFLLQALTPGEHQVVAVLANWAHVPLSPPAVDTVRFTVRAR